MDSSEIKEIVKEKYGQAAARVKSGGGGCCSASSAFGEEDLITKGLYAVDETAALPEGAVLASLGCGNPTALAELSPGETVLDLGSGGGIDVLLSARRVGPTGKAYGLDMTDEMLALAHENQQKAGIENVEFLRGEIEHIPLPDNSVDVIISDCVINLSADKDQVLAEAFRVLKPGGRFAVSDVVVRGDIPPEIRKNVELWAGCVAGALEEGQYGSKLAAAGFESIDIEPTRIYTAEDARQFLQNADLDVDSIAVAMDGKFASAFIRARKPGAAEERPARTVSLQVYDPAMCCSTGVCGPAVDPRLPRFAADLEWLAEKGVSVERFNLAQQPEAFAANGQVKQALEAEGTDCLPIVLVNGVIVGKGAYPEREQLARWTRVQTEGAKSMYTAAVAELVAIGAAVASNCEPCFRYHFDRARKLGVSKEDMSLAVKTAQMVKDNPARSILDLADKYLKGRGTEVDLLAVLPRGTGCCS
jgi:AhpD family alkylhydroperoxidase